MNEVRIPFNKLHSTGEEIQLINEVLNSGIKGISTDFISKCQNNFNKMFSFTNSLLTHSCTGALEMIALLIDVKKGDEIILPSYTFVSTANSFALRGAKLVFADCRPDFPNLDEESIEELITEKTKAIVIVHYGGVACEMETLQKICVKHNLFLIEDAAHAITGKYKGLNLGGIGDFGAFSFHSTKNVSSGEGGLLIINRPEYTKRAEIIWEKGTNRLEYNRKLVNKYEWVGLGSSFLPSEITAAMLYGQIQNIDKIQENRKYAWNYYFDSLSKFVSKYQFNLPDIKSYADHNAHVFFLLLNSEEERNNLKEYLAEGGVIAQSHYLPLHLSPYYKSQHDGRKMSNAVRYSKHLLRLPLYSGLSILEQDYIIELIIKFFNSVSSSR